MPARWIQRGLRILIMAARKPLTRPVLAGLLLGKTSPNSLYGLTRTAAADWAPV